MRYRSEGSPNQGQADTATNALARALGWFSIGLGLMELTAPKALAGALGMEDKSGLIQGYGAREVANGVAILASEDPTPWIWTRVGGDGLDIATLLTGMESGNPNRGNVAIALAMVAGVTAVDLFCARKLSAESPRPVAPLRDYSERSGFAVSAEAARGLASDFEVPRDIRGPDEMRAM